ncbi:TGACG-sequence-specific DNA-binding protein TGA-2.1 [Hordeum vulgare]|nr:TGACG-sequence-specific DNA-binding protein TGA-2.1 [Hordeum vulgare]
MAKLLAEENKIMTLNRDDMDDITKEWHDMVRRDILKWRMVAAAGGCFNAGDVFPTGVGTSAADAFSAPNYTFGAGVGTSAGDELGGGDGIAGGGAE